MGKLPKKSEKELENMRRLFKAQLLQSKLDKNFYKEIEKPFKKLYTELIQYDPRISCHGAEIAILDGLPKGVMV